LEKGKFRIPVFGKAQGYNSNVTKKAKFRLPMFGKAQG